MRLALFAACITVAVFLLALNSPVAEGSPDGNLTVVAYTYNGGEVLKMGIRTPRIDVVNLLNGSRKTFNTHELHVRLPDGIYRVEIYWMGQLVFNDTVSISNNTVFVKANCTVGRVRFFVMDDEDRRIYEAEVLVKVSTEPIEVEEGKHVLLPFGEHTVSRVVYTLKLQDDSLQVELQPVEGREFSVGGDRDVVVKVPVRHSVKLSFFKLGDVPLTGASYKVKVILAREGRKYLLKELVLSSSNEVTLVGVPYGDYAVKVFKGDEVLLERPFSVDKSVSEVKLVVSIIPKVRMVFADVDGRPLAGFNLTLLSPDGEEHCFILDTAGALFLFDAKPGVYMYSITVNRIEVKGRVDVLAAEVSGGSLEKRPIRVPIRYVLVRIVDEGGAGIPPGLIATLRYGSLLVGNVSVTERSKAIAIDVGYLPTDKNYELAIEWEGATIANRTLSGPCEVEVFFKNVKVIVISRTKRPLIDALVEVKLHNGSVRTFKCSGQGAVVLPYAVGGYTYTARIYWKGVRVAEASFDPEDLEEDVVEVAADVGSLIVEVKGWLDKPVREATVNLTLKMFNGSLLLFTAETDSNGVAQFPFVPLAGTGVERALLSARYGRFGPVEMDITADLTEPIIKKQLRLDVVELVDGLALSMLETVGIAAILTVTSLALVIAYRKLALKKEIESMLTESDIYAYREAKWRWPRSESFIERLKERLSMLKGGEFEEEEEEWEIFD